MRVLYPENIRKTAAGYPVQKKSGRRQRLNKKKFAGFIVVLLVLAAGSIAAWGLWHGTVARTFSAVANWFYMPETTAGQTAESTGIQAAKTPGPKPSAQPSETPSPETPKSSTASDIQDMALPAFLRSGPGEMKAFSIKGIDPADDKVVALTFDDGPNPSTTDEILDALKKYGGHATFFVIGERAKQFPQTVKNILDGGNEIGNHTYDHTDLKTVSADKIHDEIDKTNDVLASEVGARPILVRPPNGSITQKIAEDIGKACVLWTVDPEDWKYRNVDKDYNNVMDVVRDGDIVLMHDIYKQSADAAQEIIRDLTKQGYKLVTVSQMIQIAQARGKSVGLIVSDLRAPKSTGTGKQ